ncbi:MAG: ligase-associated DNA damage response DEXH box helicase [Ferruginibacter sp.]
MKLTSTFGYTVILAWLSSKERKPFAFQKETWEKIIAGESGIVNAPTGYGKTYSVFLGAIIQYINQHPKDYQSKKSNGLQLLWVTPLRALAKDIGRAMEEVILELGMQWKVGIRNGDTPVNERQKQKRNMPEVLITTPESLHLLLAQKDYPELFKSLHIVAVDEWHELLGGKRGVQMELAISRLVGLGRKQPAVGNRQLTDGSLQSAVRSSQFGGNISQLVQGGYGIESEKLKVKKGNNKPRAGVSVWGISATIGNLEEAKEVLLASLSVSSQLATVDNRQLAVSRKQSSPDSYQDGSRPSAGNIIKASIHKKIEIESIIPDEIEKYPWAGHLGIKLAHKALPIIEANRTTLLFINTRGMSEIWYQQLLNIAPELAGALALHHGSIEQELRIWVEDALHTGTLKAVVATSSLDLGVDFRPVETVIQVGSPKGVARFLQRAGRSGHQPGSVSKIHFLPTHSLELMEAAALKDAIANGIVESRQPMLLCFDVLMQYLCTLAVGEGFYPDEIFKEISCTYCFRDIQPEEWEQILQFITAGGIALAQYDDFKKVEIINGLYKITNRRIAMRHRMHIGTIVSDAMIKVKFMTGGFIGVIEEWFISRLQAGDVFTLAGRNLEFVMIKEMTVQVRKSNSKKSIVPSWMGGRLPLSARLGQVLRKKLDEAAQLYDGIDIGKKLPGYLEMKTLKPLFELQQQISQIPRANELLIEHIETKDGFHVFVYPFEGRLVHEAMAALLSYRLSRISPLTFSFAMNDYGFELLCDQPIPLDDSNVYDLFSEENLLTDIQTSVNASEMARRKFRDIAVIGGLIFQGMPGEKIKSKHLQSSASLLFNVFAEYEPNNLLIRQAYNEVMQQQMDEVRLRDMLRRIQQGKIVIKFPKQLTPFCFPLKVDSMRENLTSEKLEDRVKRMQQQLD